jgi:hypothetical protein
MFPCITAVKMTSRSKVMAELLILSYEMPASLA